MELIKTTSKEYTAYLNTPYHVYNSVNFSELNKKNADELFYIVFKTKKVKLGIILGRKDCVLHSPFSAPFGGFSFLKEDLSMHEIDNAIDLLKEYGKANNLCYKISLPPEFYHPNFLAKSINAFKRKGFENPFIDINHYFDLNYLDDYNQKITYNARKNLNNSKKHNLLFEKAEDNDAIKLAYSVIKENRVSKGYPLKMSLEAVMDTIKVVKSDFFNLFFEGQSIASAQIFHVSDKVVQIIYWGDKPGFSELRPMNFLSYKVIEHYKNLGFCYIDIGPSSEEGVPNYGLCEFKESIGSSISNKYTFWYGEQ